MINGLLVYTIILYGQFHIIKNILGRFPTQILPFRTKYNAYNVYRYIEY